MRLGGAGRGVLLHFLLGAERSQTRQALLSNDLSHHRPPFISLLTPRCQSERRGEAPFKVEAVVTSSFTSPSGDSSVSSWPSCGNVGLCVCLPGIYFYPVQLCISDVFTYEIQRPHVSTILKNSSSLHLISDSKRNRGPEPALHVKWPANLVTPWHYANQVNLT